MYGQTQVNGSYNQNYNGNYNNGYNGGYGDIGSGVQLGSLFTGQEATITFTATVTNSQGSSIENTASASASNAPTVQASAWVFVNGSNVLGSNINLVYSKKAWNDTQNVDATTQPASKEDYITYTLTATNNGNADADNFVITDDLSNVLPYADITDNGGGSLNGNGLLSPALRCRPAAVFLRVFRFGLSISWLPT